MKPLFFFKNCKSMLAMVVSVLISGTVGAQTNPPASPSKKAGLAAKVAVNTKAHFKGGDGKLAEYLKNNLQYPQNPGQPRLKGAVTVKFTIEMDGNINELSVLKSLGKYYDSEALRVIRDSPKWEPAMQKGQPVRSYIVLPINFIPPGK